MYAKQYYVYILLNQRNTVPYTGVTDDLVERVHQHKQSLRLRLKTKVVKGFTARYNIDKLVYYEIY